MRNAAVAGLRAKLAALQPGLPAEPDQRTQTLKQVSILFLDVVGSTSLALSPLTITFPAKV